MTKRGAAADEVAAVKVPCFNFTELHIVTDRYILHDVLGSGTAGVVHRATPRAARADGTEGITDVAVKCYLTKSDHWEANTKREIECMRKIPRHENIIELIEVATNDARDSIYTVLEYLPYDLRWLLRRHASTLPLGQIKGYMQQLLSGVSHMHGAGVMHRDLKPENVLISAGNVLKIADFGLAGATAGNPYHTVMVVTIWYRAPEILLAGTATTHARYDSRIDVWSVGAIMGEFLLGGQSALFQNNDKTEAPDKQLLVVYDVCGTPTRDTHAEWPEYLQRVLPGSYTYARVDRLSDGTAIKAKSVRPVLCTPSALSALCSMLCMNPLRRSTAAQVLAMPYFALDSPKPYPAEVMCRIQRVK